MVNETVKKETIRTLNKLLKEKGRSEDTEVTRFKGEYYVLHICRNDTPVPLFHDKDISEIKNYIEVNVLERNVCPSPSCSCFSESNMRQAEGEPITCPVHGIIL